MEKLIELMKVEKHFRGGHMKNVQGGKVFSSKVNSVISYWPPLASVKDDPACPALSGPLMGGPQCRMSILRNGNIARLCRLFSPMSHVKFKKRPYPMSLYFHPHVTCH